MTDLISSTTSPLIQTKSPIASKEMSRVTYDFRNGKSLDLSQREKLVSDVFIRTQNLSLCRAELKKVFNKDVQERSIKKWMERPHVKDYLDTRLREWGIANGWSREKWIAYGTERTEKPMKDDLISGFFWKQLGMALGYMESGINIKGENVAIQFTQKDGEV